MVKTLDMLGMGDEAGVEDTGLFAGERFSGTKTVRNMSTITDLYMCSNLISSLSWRSVRSSVINFALSVPMSVSRAGNLEHFTIQLLCLQVHSSQTVIPCTIHTFKHNNRLHSVGKAILLFIDILQVQPNTVYYQRSVN